MSLRAPLTLLAACVALGGCSRASTRSEAVEHAAAARPATLPACVSYATLAAGKVTSAALHELSGLVVGRRQPQVLWTHNDSGDAPRIYGLDRQGRHVATFELEGATADDWEDIAIAACSPAAPDPCLYLADTGDNFYRRPSLALYRVPEPAVLPPLPAPGALPDVTRIPSQGFTRLGFMLPAGPANVESLVALPDGRLVIVTKRKDHRAEVFRLTPGPTAITQVEPLGELGVVDPADPEDRGAMATGADLSPDGAWLLVRTYNRLWLFGVGGALGLPPSEAPAALRRVARVRVPAPVEPQGESVAWDPAGGYWLVSESNGDEPTLWRVACAPSRP